MKIRCSYLTWRASPVVLAAGALATLISTYLLVTRGLRQDYSIESLVARTDQAYVTYRRFLAEFVSNEIAIIAVRGRSPLSPEALKLLHELCVTCRKLPGVQEVSAVSELPPLADLARLPTLSQDPGAFLGQAAVVDLLRREPHRREDILRQLLADPLIADNLISRDGRTAAVLCRMLSTFSPTASKQAVARLRETVAAARRAHPDLEIVLAGPAVTMVDMFDYIHKDLVLFSFVVFALMSVALGLIFRRVRLAVLTMGVAAAATVTTLGLSVVLNMPMSLVTQMIVILSSILAVANLVHLIVAWEETRSRRSAGGGSLTALLTLRRMIGPTAAAAVTTAVGFGSLRISDLVPLKDFAALMSFAILAGWLLGLSAVRFLGALGGPEPVRRQPSHGPLARLLQRVAGGAERRPAAVGAVFGAVFLGSVLGIPRLRFESDFLKNFRPGSGVRQAYAFIETHLAPVGSVELVVRRRDGGDILTHDCLSKAHQVAGSTVEAFGPIRKAMSLADLLTVGGQSMPQSTWAIKLRVRLIEAIFGPQVLRNFLNRTGTAMRINLRAVEGIQVSEKLRMADSIRELASRTFGHQYDVQLTGLYPFYAGLVAGLLRDQNLSFALAGVVIFFLMAGFLRSLKLGILALAPNVLPIGLTMGLMGWRGIPVNMATAMILAVSLGIAVDHALHYTWRFRREWRRRRDAAAAMLTAHATTGRACVFTTLVIVSGFWVLCLSEFLPTAYFGGLIGVTMLGAALADLVLFPMLLVRLYGAARPGAAGSAG